MDKEEVIDNYLLWELCKQRGIQKMIKKGSADGERLKEEIIEKVRQEYQEKDYSFEEKKRKLNDLDSNPDYRNRILEEHTWEKKKVDIEDLGTTLPRAGDLPPEIITSSLPEVVEFVKKIDPEEYQSLKYINNLKEVPEVLDEFLPWVVAPGKRKSKRERMNKVHGEKDWNIKDTWGMINDGNHRTIAKILANGSKEIKCYVGRSEM